MKRFKTLEHKADLKIRAVGSDKEDLFLNMLLGMQSALRAKVKNQKSKIKIIKVKSLDLGALLVDFLSEILYQIQTNKEIYSKINFKKFTDTDLEVGIFGQKVERFGEDIKAATYHQLDIHQKEDKTWEATVLFDI